MVSGNGYSGKILRVDLSSQRMSATPTSDYSEKYVGGRGIATKIYWDEIPRGIKAFDPENRLIVVTGPLGGFPGLAASRWLIFGKSPFTDPEGFSYCNLGGDWGAYLKFAGYDGIVVEGISERPSYLLVRDGKAEIRDASHIWGKGSVETREALKGELGGGAKVLATGPGGENLVNYATVLAENDASGGSGYGAVFGSKNLKAIVVVGNTRPQAANPEELEGLTRYVRELYRDRRTVPMPIGAPVTGVTEKIFACYGCVFGCDKTMARTSDGVSSKRYCQSGCFYQERVRRYYGDYTDVIIQATRLCNDYGLDTKIVDALIMWISRCRKAGILNDENTGLPISKMGSLEFIEALVRKAALREGFGATLALGNVGAAQAVGGGAEKLVAHYSSSSSGDALRFDPRTYITTGMIWAVEPRLPTWQLNEIGALMGHFGGWVSKGGSPEKYAVGQPSPLTGIPIQDPQAVKAAVEGCYVSGEVIRKIAKKFWGSEVAGDFSTFEGKALAAKMIQDRSYAKECLVMCAISWPNLHNNYSEDHVGDPDIEARLLSAVTGSKIDTHGLYLVGERVFNLQRAILMREGRQGRQSDVLPDFCFNSPLPTEAYNPGCLVPGKNGEVMSRKGVMLARSEFETMMDEYYRLRGWDPATGLQTKAKLEELGLGGVAQELKAKVIA